MFGLRFLLNLTGSWCHCVAIEKQRRSEWVEVDHLTTGSNANQMPNMAVCGSRVLLANRDAATRLQVFDVSAERTLRDAGYVSAE